MLQIGFVCVFVV